MNKYLPGLIVNEEELSFEYTGSIVGPKVEIRYLDDIRCSLKEYNCTGPSKVYSIVMDVYDKKDYSVLLKQNLLFGVVTYAQGTLGSEPIRSQGHRHAISKSCGKSTGELYEVWSGEAIIYMQDENSNKCYAVLAKSGDKVLVPPSWIHATINASPEQNLTFGAWCVRDYGFDYSEVREKQGIAFFPSLTAKNTIKWEKNENYKNKKLIIKSPRVYEEFRVTKEPIYKQFENDETKFRFISNPNLSDFDNFIP